MTQAEPALPADHPTRLNLGCGFDRREGYLNVDLMAHHEPDLLADVRSLPMLESGRYTEILAIDVLEHLARSDTATALAEWARLLGPGGMLKLQVPDLLACSRRLLAARTLAEHEQWVHHLWGTQAYTGDFHLAGFTDLLLVDALHRAGFHRIRLQSRDEWMLEVEAERIGPGPHDPLAIGWLDGAYPEEWGDGGVSWRWTSGRTELVLVNTGSEELTVDVFANLADVTDRPCTYAVRVDGDVTEYPSAGPPVPWQSRLTLPVGARRVEFSSDAPAVPVPPDTRPLGLRIDLPNIAVVPAP